MTGPDLSLVANPTDLAEAIEIVGASTPEEAAHLDREVRNLARSLKRHLWEADQEPRPRVVRQELDNFVYLTIELAERINSLSRRARDVFEEFGKPYDGLPLIRDYRCRTLERNFKPETLYELLYEAASAGEIAKNGLPQDKGGRGSGWPEPSPAPLRYFCFECVEFFEEQTRSLASKKKHGPFHRFAGAVHKVATGRVYEEGVLFEHAKQAAEIRRLLNKCQHLDSISPPPPEVEGYFDLYERILSGEMISARDFRHVNALLDEALKRSGKVVGETPLRFRSRSDPSTGS